MGMITKVWKNVVELKRENANGFKNSTPSYERDVTWGSKSLPHPQAGR